MSYRELNSTTDTIQNSLEPQAETASFSLIEVWEQLRRHWIWFVLGLLVAWSCAYIYLRYTQNLYSAEAKILLKEDFSKAGSELSVLTGKGLGEATRNPIFRIRLKS